MHKVTLIKVIGADTDADQVMHQLALNIRVVIHTGQQHGLVPKGDTCPGQFIASIGEFGRDLVGMVDVDVEPERVELLQHVSEVIGDPLRHKHRDTGTDPDDLDMWNLT